MSDILERLRNKDKRFVYVMGNDEAAEIVAIVDALRAAQQLAKVADEVTRDAARYRYLRTKAQTGAVRTFLPLYQSHFVIVNESAHDYPEFDDAVDALLAASGEVGG